MYHSHGNCLCFQRNFMCGIIKLSPNIFLTTIFELKHRQDKSSSLVVFSLLSAQARNNFSATYCVLLNIIFTKIVCLRSFIFRFNTIVRQNIIVDTYLPNYVCSKLSRIVTKKVIEIFTPIFADY